MNLFDQRANLGDETVLFGPEKHPQCTRQCDSEPLRVPPRQALINDDQISVRFLCESQNFCFSPIKVRQ